MGFDLPVMNRLRRSGRALSPASLFATGAQGVIYDPRDLSTMFQDSLGTTPVTAPGQVVGLRLDKSKGLALGSEVVVNGSFDSGTGWVAGAGWTISGGKASASAASADLYQISTGAAAGKTYKVTFTISDYVSGSCRIELRGGITPSASANGTFTALVRGNTTDSYIYVVPASFTGSIDNISVRELAGNHATQATAGARLTYGIEPKTGTRNTLTQTEAFNSTVWTKTSVLTLTTDATTAPDGTATADLITETATSGLPTARYTLATGVVSGTYSVYAKANGRNHVCLSIYGGAAFKYSAAVYDLSTGAVTKTQVGTSAVLSATDMVSVGSGWYRLSMSYTITAPVVIDPYIHLVNSATPTIDVYGTPAVYTGDGVSGTYLWGAQLEASATATPYQKVVTAFEVTEAGIPTCHYCAYAGANSMATAAIDFTATDKMSVFMGVRKLSDGSASIMVELSTDWYSSAGAFAFTAPDGGGAKYGIALNGTNPVFASLATFTAPITNVVTQLYDIAGATAATEMVGRVNGSAVSLTGINGADAGTGNFGNYTLNIGRRNNASLPFNGRDYGIVIVGKATSAAEINITEAWLAANTPTVVL